MMSTVKVKVFCLAFGFVNVWKSRLRALSSGGSVTSPPPSPAMPKYKLAEYRYGREEMLALYIKDNKRNFSMSVNSVAVLRLMGKGVGGAAPAGVVRGRGVARGGRGRGRGEGGFYQRTIEEPEVGFGRGVREIHRSQSWDDRGERRFEKPVRREVGRPGFEEAVAPVVPGRKEYTRADSDNWRILREEQQEAEEAAGVEPVPVPNWRLTGIRRDAGWREHPGPGESRRRKFDFDFRDSEGGHGGGGRRRAGSEGLEDDRSGLPEWCTDDEDGEMGTFDSSGAFMTMKTGGKDIILEEEFEFKGIEEEEEEREEEEDIFADIERNSAEGDKDKESKEAGSAVGEDETKRASPPSSSPPALRHGSPPCLEARPSNAGPAVDNLQLNNSHAAMSSSSSTAGDDIVTIGGFKFQLGSGGSNSSSLPPPPPCSAAPFLPPPGGDAEDDEGMKHLQQMVASLQDTSLEEECFTQALQQQDCRNTAAALPLSHEAAMKWFYKDPQGEIQGPFTTVEMCEWFQAGYFTMTLLVKRGCDEGFQPLGDVIKMWGRVPFAPGPSPPPLLVRQPPPTQRSQSARGSAGSGSQSSANVEDGEGRMQRRGKIDRQGNLDQDRLKKQQELAAAALYQQLQQQQLFQLINRCSEQGIMPSMNRSMSVPDTGSMWDMRDMHTSASQPPGGEASLWDITMNPSTQGPTLEQLQKLQQERRDAELRAKREEEEQRKRREEKRRLQEEQKRREEEELFRRKQCRQQQELIMKLLQQTPQQQGPGASSSGWSGSPSSGLSKSGKPPALALLEMQQEAERLLKQQQQQRAQQRERHSGLSMGSPSMGGQWADGVSMWGGSMEGKGGSVSSSGGMGMWDEAVKNQTGLRGNSNNNMGLKNSRSSPSLSEQYMMRRKRTEEEEKLLKLLQGMKPQDGFTTWCEQMLHALNTSANNSSSSLDVATIVAYLKEVESPYAVLDFIRSYLGDTVEAKEFAKQFLERRAKQKANQQRQQQQDSMRGMNPSTLQSMFQANHMSKSGLYDNQGGKMKKKQPMMLHSDPSILGGDRDS
ncbi:PERQ amino acid-rich with GYF domain-containing protein 2 [Liparis tanakae]|uniref:PERQ amino acid-rich with GYF domain-containing protein 2 n=1 Tax=Liparis tanakae TaxID=230148 RepID=A0A4Z2FH58_9TELE|nr:PERQ amino acid-rich with GYF domain-containing protein 2 [Liparis tanakae]